MTTSHLARILVVDDLKDWRSTLCGVLGDEGFRACGVSSFDEAIDLLKSEHFDIALLDIRLDDTDEDNRQGIELARRLRELEPNLKIVMITAYGLVNVVNDALMGGGTRQVPADDFLEKRETSGLVNLIKKLI